MQAMPRARGPEDLEQLLPLLLNQEDRPEKRVLSRQEDLRGTRFAIPKPRHLQPSYHAPSTTFSNLGEAELECAYRRCNAHAMAAWH